MDVAVVKLNTGAGMPAIGFGTWQLADGQEAKTSVLAAIKAGYRLIDTAKIYGNERSVGEAVRPRVQVSPRHPPAAVDEYTICFPSGVKFGPAFSDAIWL